MTRYQTGFETGKPSLKPACMAKSTDENVILYCTNLHIYNNNDLKWETLFENLTISANFLYNLGPLTKTLCNFLVVLTYEMRKVLLFFLSVGNNKILFWRFTGSNLLLPLNMNMQILSSTRSQKRSNLSIVNNGRACSRLPRLQTILIALRWQQLIHSSDDLYVEPQTSQQ